MSSHAFQVTILTATFLCSAWFGMMYFAAVALMPGIADLDDRAFLRTFQVIDGIFQAFPPLIFLVWVGSAIALIAAATMSLYEESWKGTAKSVLLTTATLADLSGHVTTAVYNVPLNNHIQTLKIDEMGLTELAQERANFEPTWNYWNVYRVYVEGFTCLSLMMLLSLNDFSMKTKS